MWSGAGWKKSKVLGVWKKKFIVVDDLKLNSYQSQNQKQIGNEPTFTIQLKQIKQIAALIDKVDHQSPVMRIRFGMFGVAQIAIIQKQQYFKFIWQIIVKCMKLKQVQVKSQELVFEEQIFKIPFITSICSSFLYKKSRYLKSWKERYVLITKQKLMSFKQQKFEVKVQPSFEIRKQSVTCVRTNFEKYKNYLVYTVQHGNNIHTSFAVPINVTHSYEQTCKWDLILLRLIKI